MQFKHFLLIIVAAIILSGCQSIEYTGEEFPETPYVKLFFDKRFISQKDYQQIGTATMTVPGGASSSDIDQSFIAKGKSVGADAILIVKTQTVNEGPLVTEGNTNDGPVEQESSVMGLKADGQPNETNSFGDVQAPGRVANYEFETIVNAVFYKKKRSIHKIQEEDKARSEGVEFDKKKVYVNKAKQAELARKYKTLHQKNDAQDKKASESAQLAKNAEKEREQTSLQTQDALNKTSQQDKEIINKKDKDNLIVDSLKSQEKAAAPPKEVSDQKAFDKEFNPDDKNDPLYDKYKNTLNKDAAPLEGSSKSTMPKAKEEPKIKPQLKTQDLDVKPPQDKEIDKILNEIKKETKAQQQSDGNKSEEDNNIK